MIDSHFLAPPNLGGYNDVDHAFRHNDDFLDRLALYVFLRTFVGQDGLLNGLVRLFRPPTP